MTLRISDAAHRTGATPRQLEHWRLKGVVAPKRHTAGGHAIYDAPDLRRIRLMKVLTAGNVGLSTQRAAKLIDLLHTEVERMIEVASAEAATRALGAVLRDR